jgi:hypothetical protein
MIQDAREALMEDPEKIATDSRRVTDERTRLLRAAVEKRLQERRDHRETDAAHLGR